MLIVFLLSTYLAFEQIPPGLFQFERAGARGRGGRSRRALSPDAGQVRLPPVVLFASAEAGASFPAG